MFRLAYLVVALALSPLAAANDLNLLLGWQYNRDMEIGDDPHPGSGQQPGHGVDVDNDIAYSVGLDFWLPQDPTGRLGALLTYSSSDLGSDAGLADQGLDFTHLHLTGTRYYPRGNWEPFVMAGLGAAFISPGDGSLDDATRVSTHIAGGFNYRFSPRLALRLELRWLGTFVGGGGEAICSGGCTVAFATEVYSQVQGNLGLQFSF